MKFSVDPKDLVQAISTCQRAISSRSTMDILQFIYFQVKENQLTLRATDMELAIETSLPCQAEEEGEAMIFSRIIGDIARKLPSAPAVFTQEDRLMRIDCLNSHFSLPLQNPEEFPDFPRLETREITQLDNKVLKEAVEETEFATSTDEAKLSLTGIYLERRKGEVRFVALDGYRLAVRRIPLEEGEGDFEGSVIVPRRAMNEAARMMPEEGKVSFSFEPGRILFQAGRNKLYSQLIDQHYLPYQEIIPTEEKSLVRIQRSQFLPALERANLLIQGDRANLVKMTFSSDSLHIQSNSEMGKVDEKVPVENQGEELQIAFNSRYLLEGIRAIPAEDIILKMNGSLNPMVVQPLEREEDYLYLVLPVRLAQA